MSILKHLKILQHVSIIIQIIFRELVGSLLMHNVRCVCVAFCVERHAGQHTSPHRTPHTHTPNVMLPHYHK